jgi:rsbT co-antagonist protein RsbR
LDAPTQLWHKRSARAGFYASVPVRYDARVPPDNLASLLTEIAALQSRATELEHALDAARVENERLLDKDWQLRIFFEVTQETIAATENGRIIDVNKQFVTMAGITREEALGRSPLDFTAPEAREEALRHIQSGSEEPYDTIMLRSDGARIVVRARGRMFERHGRKIRITALLDVTAQRQAEEALRHASLREETLRIQNDLVARISAPLLPISDNAIVMPLIAQVNEGRAAQVMATLTAGVVTYRAHYAILDVTGVDGLDGRAVDLLVSSARAVALLGAEMIVTGIRPELALRLVDCNLGHIKTFGTLRQGVAHALLHR